MPIRINLLAEAQAAEEMRRRDPVKRALWGASIVVVGVIAFFLPYGTDLKVAVMLMTAGTLATFHAAGYSAGSSRGVHHPDGARRVPVGDVGHGADAVEGGNPPSSRIVTGEAMNFG